MLGVGSMGWEGEEERQKSRSEEKVMGFSSASLFPARKWEAVTMVEATCVEGNLGSGYRQKVRRQARIRPHSRYIHVKQI